MAGMELERMTRIVLERAGALALYARQWLDPASADDVVQEALTNLLMQRRLPDDPVAWMFRAVRNAAIDYSRGASHRRKREQVVAREHREWFESRPDSLIDAKTAEESLRHLAPEERQIVVLRIWGELGFTQIAELMQMSVSTAHGRYVSALEQMRKRLEQPCRNNKD